MFLNTPIQEKDLLIALHQGSEYAFKEIYQLYSPRLYGNLLRIVKSDIQSKLILQDIFLELWEQRSAIEPEQPFRTYLLKIAENKVFDFFVKLAKDEADLVLKT